MITLMGVQAETFTVGSLSYTTISNVSVKCTGLTAAAAFEHPSMVIIPGRVTNNGTEYRVTTIGEKAFYGNSYLTSVRMGWGIQTIDTDAFKNCSSLAFVGLPSSITKINSGAFVNCTSMAGFRVAAITPPTVATGAFYGMASSVVVTSTYAAQSAYNAKEVWKAIDNNENVGYDGTLANDFGSGGVYYIYSTDITTASGSAKCTLVGVDKNVTSTSMGPTYDYTCQEYGNGSPYKSDITQVAGYACQNHPALTTFKVLISTGTLIDSHAFYNCQKLKTVMLYGNNLQIGTSAFGHCTALNDLKLYNTNEATGISSIGSYAFYDTGVTEVYIPSSLSSYGSGAFAGCTKLTKFTVSANSTHFAASEGGALYDKNFARLYQVGAASTVSTTAKGCRSIMPYAWWGNTKVTDLDVRFGVTTIQSNAFGNMTQLNYLKIPSSVKTITTDALDNLKTVNGLFINMKNPPTVSLNNLNSTCYFVNVPHGSVKAYKNHSSWQKFNEYLPGGYDFMVADANSIYKFYYTVDSVYSYTDTNVQSAAAAGTACMVQGRRAYTEGNYPSTIPVANYVADIEDKHYIVTNIAPSFCRYTDNITAINGGKGLKVIGDSAFKGCKQLKSFSLPNLREIGAAAFRDCIRLSSITLGNKLETLGLSAFYGCTSLTGEIVIPSSIKMIRSYCFAHCSNLNSLFLESVSSATIYKRFFQYNASGFKCYVNLNDYYRLYGLADWSDDNGTAMSRLVPFYKAIYEWSAISSFASMKLPTDATFYTIPSYDAATHTAKTQVITGTVKGKTGLLVHATPGKMYRFDLPTGTIVTPTNLLKGAGQDNLLITPPSNSSYYYFKSSEKKFVHFTNDRTFQAYHCYLDIPLATAPATDIIKVDIIPYTNFIKGDVNGDGKVNVSDVTALINMILGITTTDQTRADVNGDGKVNVSDVTALINLILGIN